MKPEWVQTIEQLAARSAAGSISFGEVVGQLMAIGLERYHCDYTRMENTYYMPDGESLVLKMAGEPHAVGNAFDAAEVERAVRRAQRGEIVYPEFSRIVTAAGCVGYFVQITGRQVLYFGRNGDCHKEVFPKAK